MTRRVLYTGGSIAIAAEGYLHSPYGDGDGDENETEDVPIPGLDRVITNATMLTFTLDYPFPQPYAGRVFGKGGITLRHVIDAIRKGFGAMYAGAGVTDVPNLANRIVAMARRPTRSTTS
jgi:hypothetical protein